MVTPNLCLAEQGHWTHPAMLGLSNVTQRQLMRLFAVKLSVIYEQKCSVRSKFLKN